MTEWLSSAINLPEFPDVNTNFLPLQAFNGINIDVDIPDLTAIADLPSKAFNRVMNQLPPPFSGILDCENDINCILKQVGMGDVVNFVAPFSDMFGKVGSAVELLQDVLAGVKCKEWKSKSVAISDILAEIGLPDIDACDVDIPYCEEFDLSAVGEAVLMLEDIFQSVIDLLETSSGRRRLSEDDGVDKYYPILGLNLGASFFSDAFQRFGKFSVNIAASYIVESGEGARRGRKSAGADNDDREEQLMGFHFQGDMLGSISFGVVKRNGEKRFGMEMGVALSGKFGHMTGPRPLLSKCVQFIEELDELKPESKIDALVDPRGHCNRLDAPTKLCGFLKKMKKAVMATPPHGCTQPEIEDLSDHLKGTTFRTRTADQNKQSHECIQYWFTQYKSVQSNWRSFTEEEKRKDLFPATGTDTAMFKFAR